MTSTESAEGGAPSTDQGQPPVGRRRGPGPLLIVVLVVLVVAAGTFAFVANRHRAEQSQLIRVSGLPSSVSTSLATLMALSPVPAKMAPDFTLTDQNGHTLSLSSFRGHSVVLEFMDTHCTDICPIISQEFIDAYHDLGPQASHVVFVAVNVNGYHVAVSDVAGFTKEHQLNTIRNWHFFTGPVSDLQSVWSSYGVAVQAPSPNADIIHSSFAFFIDPTGHERYLANPTDDHTASGASYLPAGPLASWGQGIALVSRSLTG
jgi:cytochrome oxidase Cu insertion factor (SCO1/SenC/PrrC family)